MREIVCKESGWFREYLRESGNMRRLLCVWAFATLWYPFLYIAVFGSGRGAFYLSGALAARLAAGHPALAGTVCIALLLALLASLERLDLFRLLLSAVAIDVTASYALMLAGAFVPQVPLEALPFEIGHLVATVAGIIGVALDFALLPKAVELLSRVLLIVACAVGVGVPRAASAGPPRRGVE